MNYTPNYNLKKPGQDDFYNIEDFNENADIIDVELKKLDEKIENIEVSVTSVNEKTGDVVLTADDVGAETPAGAQAKVNAALNSAKQYTDQEVGEVSQALAAHKAENASTSKKGHVQLTDSVSSTSTTTAATPNSVKKAYDLAAAAMPKSGSTFTGIVVAQNNTSYTTKQVRNIILSTSDPSGGSNGDIWIKYKA